MLPVLLSIIFIAMLDLGVASVKGGVNNNLRTVPETLAPQLAILTSELNGEKSGAP